MIRPSLLALTLVLLAAFRAPTPAQLAAIDPGRTEAVLQGLEELCAWCALRELKAERAELQRALLHFRPRDRRLRGALGYRRRRDEWTRSRSWRAPRTSSKALEKHGAEFARQKEALLKGFLAEMRPRVEKEAPDPYVRLRARQDLVALDPENEELRAAIGEVKADGRWILAASARARKRRGEIASRAQQLRGDATAKIEPFDAPSSLVRLGLSFPGSCRSGAVNALATGGPEEARTIAAACSAAHQLYNEVLGRAKGTRGGLTFAALNRPAMKSQWLSHPSLDDGQRAFASKMGMCWATTSYCGLWQKKEAERLDMAVRQTLATLMMDDLGITMERGWAFEGLGLYLGYVVTNTRLSWFVQRTKYGRTRKDWGKKLRAQKADWYLLSRELLKSADCPDFEAMFKHDVNALTPSEMLASWALCVFLVEGHPDRAARVLQHCARQPDEAPAAFLEHLEVPFPTLRERVVRFLEETGAGR